MVLSSYWFDAQTVLQDRYDVLVGSAVPQHPVVGHAVEPLVIVSVCVLMDLEDVPHILVISILTSIDIVHDQSMLI